MTVPANPVPLPMPVAVLGTALAVAAADTVLRAWRPARANVPSNLLFLGIAWVPFFVLPYVGPWTVTALAALLALLASLDFSRMVGLSLHGRFFAATVALTVGCFPVAAYAGGRALASIPVLALVALGTAGASAREPTHVLQKLGLAWLAVLAYGYSYAHAVLFVTGHWPAVAPTTLLALVILVAKFANVAYMVARRATGRARVQLFAAPVGGASGGALLTALWPALDPLRLVLVGLVVGLALGAGTRAHTLIVADVTGEPERQRKGTMLFGFGLALAAGYWMLVLTAAG